MRVRNSIRGFVRPSVGPSVRHALTKYRGSGVLRTIRHHGTRKFAFIYSFIHSFIHSIRAFRRNVVRLELVGLIMMVKSQSNILFILLMVQPARPEAHPARSEAQPARSEAQPVRSEAQPARSEAQPVRLEPSQRGLRPS